MKILFLHFPKDNTQIEGTALPKYFSKNGHQCYLAFEKKSRNFFCEFNNDNIIDIEKNKLQENNFDLIVGKSDCFQTYDRRYFLNTGAFKVNILSLGLHRNTIGVDFVFKDEQLIKAPSKDMAIEFNKYNEYNNRANFIYTPASIGTDKNQLEFINLVEPNLIKDFTLLFSGPIKNEGYFNKMRFTLENKKIKWKYLGHLSKPEVAKVMKLSKILCLTTDPRPAQPYDPSPRVIPEAVCAGTPFFVNDLVVFNKFLQNYGLVYKNGDKDSLNNRLDKLLKKDLNTLSTEMYKTSLEKFNMEYACHQAYESIITNYKKRIK